MYRFCHLKSDPKTRFCAWQWDGSQTVDHPSLEPHRNRNRIYVRLPKGAVGYLHPGYWLIGTTQSARPGIGKPIRILTNSKFHDLFELESETSMEDMQRPSKGKKTLKKKKKVTF